MIGTDSLTIPHWNYFLALEHDLEILSRYVEFEERNFDCFSIESARILLAAASETDVVCKMICKSIDPASDADKIGAYCDQITADGELIPAPHLMRVQDAHYTDVIIGPYEHGIMYSL